MKFALICFILFSTTLSLLNFAHGSNLSGAKTIKAKQQLRVTNSQQAAQMARSRFGGKVLKVKNNQSNYRVKLIKDNGHIISVIVDAKTGRVLGGN